METIKDDNNEKRYQDQSQQPEVVQPIVMNMNESQHQP